MSGDLDAAFTGFTQVYEQAMASGATVQANIASCRRGEVAVDRGGAEVDTLLREVREGLPADVAPDIDVALTVAEVLRALDTGDEQGLTRALGHLDTLDGGLARAWRAIDRWTHGEPVPTALVAEMQRRGQLELTWRLLALRILDGDEEAERTLRRELPVSGYPEARAALGWARARRTGRGEPFSGPTHTALLRVMQQR